MIFEKITVWEKVKKALEYKYNLAIGNMLCFTDFSGNIQSCVAWVF
jgi:hypothetical protein